MSACLSGMRMLDQPRGGADPASPPLSLGVYQQEEESFRAAASGEYREEDEEMDPFNTTYKTRAGGVRIKSWTTVYEEFYTYFKYLISSVAKPEPSFIGRSRCLTICQEQFDICTRPQFYITNCYFLVVPSLKKLPRLVTIKFRRVIILYLLPVLQLKPT